MGQKVSRVWGFLVTRPLQRYNVEHRAEKVITKIEDPKGIPVRAPFFNADAQFLENMRATQPKVAEAAHKKDFDHHSRLRDVFVTSKDPAFVEDYIEPVEEFVEIKENPNRPFPLDRKQHFADFLPASMRLDEKLPSRGKLTLNMAVDILGKRKAQGRTFSSKVISEEYKLNPDVASNLVQYYSVYSMAEPVASKFQEPHDPLEAGKDWVEARVSDVNAPISEVLATKDQETKRQLTEGEINELRAHEEKLALARNRKRTKKLE